MLTLSKIKEKPYKHNVFALITIFFLNLVLIAGGVWIILFPILLATHLVDEEITESFYLSRNINLISKAYITQLL